MFLLMGSVEVKNSKPIKGSVDENVLGECFVISMRVRKCLNDFLCNNYKQSAVEKIRDLNDDNFNLITLNDKNLCQKYFSIDTLIACKDSLRSTFITYAGDGISVVSKCMRHVIADMEKKLIKEDSGLFQDKLLLNYGEIQSYFQIARELLKIVKAISDEERKGMGWENFEVSVNALMEARRKDLSKLRTCLAVDTGETSLSLADETRKMRIDALKKSVTLDRVVEHVYKDYVSSNPEHLVPKDDYVHPLREKFYVMIDTNDVTGIFDDDMDLSRYVPDKYRGPFLDFLNNYKTTIKRLYESSLPLQRDEKILEQIRKLYSGLFSYNHLYETQMDPPKMFKGTNPIPIYIYQNTLNVYSACVGRNTTNFCFVFSTY